MGGKGSRHRTDVVATRNGNGTPGEGCYSKDDPPQPGDGVEWKPAHHGDALLDQLIQVHKKPRFDIAPQLLNGTRGAP